MSSSQLISPGALLKPSHFHTAQRSLKALNPDLGKSAHLLPPAAFEPNVAESEAKVSVHEGATRSDASKANR